MNKKAAGIFGLLGGLGLLYVLTRKAKAEEPTTYTLTTSVNPTGSGEISPSEGSFEAGASVRLTATANPGYKFVSWTGDMMNTSNPITIVMDRNKSITANFELIPIPKVYLTLSAGVGGTTNPVPGTYEVNIDSEITITAIPNSGYRFVNWTGLYMTTFNPMTLTMERDMSFTASFELISVISGRMLVKWIWWQGLNYYIDLLPNLQVPVRTMIACLTKVENTGNIPLSNVIVEMSIAEKVTTTRQMMAIPPGISLWTPGMTPIQIPVPGIYLLTLNLKNEGQILDTYSVEIELVEPAPAPTPYPGEIQVSPEDNYWAYMKFYPDSLNPWREYQTRDEKLVVAKSGGLSNQPYWSILKFKVSDIPIVFSTALLRLKLYAMPLPGSSNQKTVYGWIKPTWVEGAEVPANGTIWEPGHWTHESIIWGEDTSLNLGARDLDISDKLHNAINYLNSVNYSTLQFNLVRDSPSGVADWEKWYGSSRNGNEDKRPKLILR